MQRTEILKTYKLYINGAFPRGESGRTFPAIASRGGAVLAQCCLASRKDLRDAVGAARKAQAGWAGKTAYLKGQILYRAAEMLQSRSEELVREIARSTGAAERAARAETDASIDRLVHYAGWTDKYSQVFSSVNPVATPHFNFTTPEPTGVVVVVCPDTPPLLPLVTTIAEVILSGNTAVVLTSEKYPLPAIAFAEILATSDLPGGVVNILTGTRAELASHVASHLDINAVVDRSGDASIAAILDGGAASNMKRVSRSARSPAEWASPKGQDPYRILDTVEFKTTWHPVGA